MCARFFCKLLCLVIVAAGVPSGCLAGADGLGYAGRRVGQGDHMGGVGKTGELEYHAAAVVRAPRSPEARFQLAEYLFRTDRLNEALLNYTLVIALDPDHAGALFSRSRVCMSLGLYAQALKDLNRLIVRRPGNAEFHYQRARVLVKLESVKAAYWDFLKAHELDKRYPRPTLVGEEPPVRKKTAARGVAEPRMNGKGVVC